MDFKQVTGEDNSLLIGTEVKEPQYIQEIKESHNSFRMLYYLWVSRFFILTATISLIFMVLASLSLSHLAPMVKVEPFLLENYSDSQNFVRSEAITSDMSSREKIMEMFLRQYVIIRNTIINDPIEMRTRWMGGGILDYLSSPRIYEDFGRVTKKQWEKIFKQSLVREVEIISVIRQGGDNSPVWKIDFKTYDLYNEQGNTQSQQEATLRVRYWTSSIIAYFIPDRKAIFDRLINPLGFTVVRYSQTEVDIF